MMTSREFLVVNASLFGALLISMLLSYTTRPDTNVTVVHVPARSRASVQSADDLRTATATDGSDDANLVEVGDESTLSGLHAEARQAFRSGDTDRAIELITLAVRDGSVDNAVAALNDLGVYRLQRGEMKEAAAAFSEAASRAPTYARAHFNLGTLRMKTGDFEPAVQSLSRALELNPYDAGARYNRALARTRLGNLTGAVEDYAALTDSSRSTVSAKVHYNLGVLFTRQGRTQDAIKSFRDALRLQPDHVEARFNAALLLSRFGMNAEALDDYRKVLSLRPDHRAAGLNLGALLMRENDWSAAAKHFESMISVHPSDAAFQYNLGLCRSHLEDHAGAAAAFAAAVAIDPSYVEAHYNLALALTNLGRTDDAIAHYRAAVGAQPDYFRARYNLGLLEYRKEEYDAASRNFEHALRVRPDSYNAAYNLGLALLKSNRPAIAEQPLRTARELEETVEVDYSLGLSLTRQGRLKEAALLYQAALRLDPKHAGSLERLGEDASARGRHDEAIGHLVRLRKLNPADPTAFNVGLGAYQRADFRTALRYFDVASESAGPVRKKALSMKGATLVRLGRAADATTVYEAALRESPDDRLVARNLARVLAAGGDHAAALQRLDGLLDSDPRDGETLYLIGEQHEAMGHADLAAASFRKALETTPDNQDARQALTRVAASASR